MEMAKFENRFLTPIQGFTQSKIEKAKGSPTKIAISQLPEILEGTIKAQIKGFDICYLLMIV